MRFPLAQAVEEVCFACARINIYLAGPCVPSKIIHLPCLQSVQRMAGDLNVASNFGLMLLNAHIYVCMLFPSTPLL